MSPPFSESLDKVFGAQSEHEAYNLLKVLYLNHPYRQHVPIIDGHDGAFPIWQYLESRGITYRTLERTESSTGIEKLTMDTFTVYPYDAGTQKVVARPFFGKFVFSYGGIDFIAYKAAWPHAYFLDLVFDAEDDAMGRKLASEVYRFASTLKDEIWMYQFGHWSRDKELFAAIQQARWEDVVLDEAFKEGLRRDVHLFFESKAIYEALEITWKRGILLLGPPGNGKTESIKALLKDSKYPALYVKSFTTQHGPEVGVRTIFTHARQHAPCILVIEDLDALVTPVVRSFFLNELDGPAANHGILTIATTNHPERIDDAIVNRPSRFDVKYTYDLPSKALRKEFADKWVAKINKFKQDDAATPTVVFTMPHEDISEKVAEECGGFSFAFLKELFVSFLLAFAHAHSSGKTPEAPEALLFKQIDALREQIIQTEKEAGGAGGADSSGVETMSSRMLRRTAVPWASTPAMIFNQLNQLGV